MANLRPFILPMLYLAIAISFALGTRQVLAGADANARAEFLGALWGAAVTVAGSVIAVQIVDKAKVAGERQERRDILFQLIDEVADAVAEVRSPKGDERFTEAHMQRVAIVTLNHKIKQVQDATKWLKPDTASMIRCFGFIREMSLDVEALKERTKAAHFYEKAADLTDDVKILDSLTRAARSELVRSQPLSLPSKGHEVS